jgi:signal transduction histidine kinase
MELEIEPLALRPLLESGLSVVRERAARHGIALALEPGDGVDLIEADPLRLKQAVFNLLANAVKFTPDGGRVTLSAEADGETVRIGVQDTGIGIAPDDLERIFEEFQQAGATPGTEGTGLGLALTRRFVELHGGRVEVESTPGAGSRFMIVLPLRQPHLADALVSTTGG